MMQVQDSEKWRVEEYAQVSSLLRGKKPYIIESGGELLSPEPSSGYLLYLKTGLAEVLYQDPKGAEIQMGYIFSGELCGEMGIFEHGQRQSNIAVQAVRECTIYRISYLHFRQESGSNPLLVGLMMRQLSNRLKRTTHRLTDASLLNVRDRIANLLLELAEGPLSKSHPHGRQVRISRQDIARMAGCTRESAGRAITQLDKYGFLSAKGLTMTVYHHSLRGAGMESKDKPRGEGKK